MSITFPKEYFEEGYALDNKFMTKGRLERFKESINSEDYRTKLNEDENAQYAGNWKAYYASENNNIPDSVLTGDNNE